MSGRSLSSCRATIDANSSLEKVSLEIRSFTSLISFNDSAINLNNSSHVNFHPYSTMYHHIMDKAHVTEKILEITTDMRLTHMRKVLTYSVVFFIIIPQTVGYIRFVLFYLVESFLLIVVTELPTSCIQVIRYNHNIRITTKKR